jgi:hypothetical protein
VFDSRPETEIIALAKYINSCLDKKNKPLLRFMYECMRVCLFSGEVGIDETAPIQGHTSRRGKTLSKSAESDIADVIGCLLLSLLLSYVYFNFPLSCSLVTVLSLSKRRIRFE